MLPLLAIMRHAAILGGADIEETFKLFDSYIVTIIKQKTSADSLITVTEASSPCHS